jgi:hypothetical protein
LRSRPLALRREHLHQEGATVTLDRRLFRSGQHLRGALGATIKTGFE